MPKAVMPPALAVDMGGTTTRVAVVQNAALLERLEMPTEAKNGPDLLIERLLRLIEQLGAARLPVGVACTGRVQAGCVSAINTATMPGWVNIPLQDRLGKALGVPVALLNDAKAAALAEYSVLSQPGNFMFVTVSTGIGSGLVLNGHLHNTPNGQDVGLGFTQGLNGEWLELSSSGRGLEKAAGKAGFPDVRALFDAAEAGHMNAREHLQPPLKALADRISDVDKLLGLQTLCLGGSVGLRAFTQQFLKQQLPELEVRAAQFGADAGLIGAAQFASEGC